MAIQTTAGGQRAQWKREKHSPIRDQVAILALPPTNCMAEQVTSLLCAWFTHFYKAQGHDAQGTPNFPQKPPTPHHHTASWVLHCQHLATDSLLSKAILVLKKNSSSFSQNWEWTESQKISSKYMNILPKDERKKLLQSSTKVLLFLPGPLLSTWNPEEWALLKLFRYSSRLFSTEIYRSPLVWVYSPEKRHWGTWDWGGLDSSQWLQTMFLWTVRLLKVPHRSQDKLDTIFKVGRAAVLLCMYALVFHVR